MKDEKDKHVFDCFECIPFFPVQLDLNRHIYMNVQYVYVQGEQVSVVLLLLWRHPLLIRCNALHLIPDIYVQVKIWTH